jgi:hypothetical protein
MRKALLMASFSVTSATILVGIPRAIADDPATGTYPEKADVWKRFAIKDVKLGTELSKLKQAGFTCDHQDFRPACVMFLDAKCKGRPTKITPANVGSQMPAGQSCFLNSVAGSAWGGTFLDRKLVTLSHVVVEGTHSNVPRVDQIIYRFPKDVLTEDSNLGKALIAKYGKPNRADPPTSMTWTTTTDPNIILSAMCEAQSDDCRLEVSDDDFRTAEGSIKDAADKAKDVKSGPAAPKF